LNGVRRSGSGDGKQRKIPFIQAFFLAKDTQRGELGILRQRRGGATFLYCEGQIKSPLDAGNVRRGVTGATHRRCATRGLAYCRMASGHASGMARSKVALM
jgi:hypothetical protein